MILVQVSELIRLGGGGGGCGVKMCNRDRKKFGSSGLISLLDNGEGGGGGECGRAYHWRRSEIHEARPEKTKCFTVQ